MVEDIPPLLGAGARFAIAGVAMLVLPRRARAPRARLAAQPRRGGTRRPAAAGRRQRPRDRRRARRARRARRPAHRLGAAMGRPACARRSAVSASTAARSPGSPSASVGLGAAPAPRQPAGGRRGGRRAARARGRVLVGHRVVPLAAPEHAVRSAGVDRLADGRRRRSACWPARWLSGESGDLHLASASTKSLLAFAYLVVAGSLVAFTAYAWLLQNVPISKVATYAYVNPLVAVLLGVGAPERAAQRRHAWRAPRSSSPRWR